MADKAQDNAWSLPKFYFSIQFGDGATAKFQEVSGLETETGPIETRHGNNPGIAAIKIPGLHKTGDVTLKRGIVANDQKIWDWLSGANTKTIKRRTVVVNLLDETGAPKLAWTLHNAWPTKIVAPDLNAGSNEIAIEELVLAHDGLEVRKP
jgi:phage tail-like protein